MPLTDNVSIAIIGTGTGDGGGVAPTPDGTVAKTPSGQPNLVVQVVTPIVALLVRFAKNYLVTFLGLVTAAGIGTVTFKIQGDFHSAVVDMAVTSLVVAIVGALKDAITIFGRLEGKYPLATGSI